MHKISINQHRSLHARLTQQGGDAYQKMEFPIALFQVRGDDQQQEQVGGAGHGLEHGGHQDLHRLRGRRRHRGQRGRQQDLGQGDQERDADRGLLEPGLQVMMMIII